jgi:hypothetical protein
MKIIVKAIDDFGKSSPNKTIVIDPDNWSKLIHWYKIH